MKAVSEYLYFLKSKGRLLSEINSGSDEVALSANEALEAIKLLKASETPILGGDILSTNSGKLTYAYQSWGTKYHYLNWYCDKLKNESKIDFTKRSHKIARKAIKEAVEIAQKLKKDCLIVLVI